MPSRKWVVREWPSDRDPSIKDTRFAPFSTEQNPEQFWLRALMLKWMLGDVKRIGQQREHQVVNNQYNV